jgi:hypothetical protein
MLELRKYIIKKLYRRACWHEKHTAFENAYAGVPSHLKGKAKKEVKELIKEGILLEKPTCYGIQVSLNPEKIKEIMQYLED